MIVKFLTITVLGGLSFVVLLMLAPNIEQSLSESRISHAYNQVRYLADPHSSDSDDGLGPPVDPWGQPYQFVNDEDRIVRVVSFGPNMSSPADGFDDDDIYSDMPKSPMEAIKREKNLHWLFAFGISIATWILLTIAFLRSTRCVQK
ncbi:MAG: hypothetical protein R3C02_12515 [Planctomycetaceae bacterium]